VDPRSSYDRVAQEYASRFGDEMERKPFDRKMLDWLVEKVGPGELICDLGCGPGQIARYLRSQGANACGIDLSSEMVEQARRLNPEIPFQQGSMLDLQGIPARTYGGVAAFYSIVHFTGADVARALREIRRVLRPSGVLLLAFHIGSETLHVQELWGHEVALDFVFHPPEEVKRQLVAEGFVLEEVIQRDPYPPEVEHQSRRAYLFARAP
jgi:ubiquinone/menaquinone biosynthesis C-methylase UbiE